MKKIRILWFRLLNHLITFGKKQTQQERINEKSSNLLKSIMFDTTTEEQILIFEDLKDKFAGKLHQHNRWVKNESYLIDGYLKEENSVKNIQVHNPIFEEPLKTVVN